MRYDSPEHMMRFSWTLAFAFCVLCALVVGMLAVDAVLALKIRAVNERLDKIEVVLEADAAVGAAQVRFNRAVTEELEGQDPDLRVIEEELNLDKLAAEYVEVINAQPLH